ncbi:MAG: hypothetical protein HDQ93_06690 [Desulfovibrio sp.]|nr:hypothetical protein [Desulfovibrio sp.]
MKAKLYAVPSSRPRLANASRWVNCFIRNAASDALRDQARGDSRQRRIAR